MKIKLILKKYSDIMDIIIPTLGKERQKTYSPFLPICKTTGKVLQAKVKELDKKNKKIVFIIVQNFFYNSAVIF